MGVKLLWPELEHAAHETTLEALALTAYLNDDPAKPAAQVGAVPRHLVLGIDAAIWLYHALSLKHAGGGNPELRMLFFRLAKLHALPILPIFVFDGPDRPLFKRNKQRRAGGGWDAHYSFPHQAQFEQLVRLFGFVVIHAPAEAEAQLARMNADGVVDVILTDDGDAFLFGAQVVLRNSSKTLSGYQARAHRLRGRQDDAIADDSDGQSQSSAASAYTSSSSQPCAAARNRAGANAFDADSASLYSPSEGSDSESKRRKRPEDALQGKIEESFTCYRSALLFDTPRSQVDQRLFPSKRDSGATDADQRASKGTQPLDKDGLILTALLSGGDYDVHGFVRCGMKTAMALARCGYGKQLLDAFKRHFDSPAHARERQDKEPSRRRAAWDTDLSAWIEAVKDELRTNAQGRLERKAPKLAASSEWASFLRTEQALDVVRSYIWPKVEPVDIRTIVGCARLQTLSSQRVDDRSSSFRGLASSSRNVAPDSSRSRVGEAGCDLRLLARQAQRLFGWSEEQAVKRFSKLVWDGSVVRRALSIRLWLDRERAAGRAVSYPSLHSPGATRTTQTKAASRQRHADTAAADVTITPQARRFADFFAKSANIRTPQADRARKESSPNRDAAKPSPSTESGDIELLAIHGTRRHAKYAGLCSELRISYTTSALARTVKEGLVSEWTRGADGLYVPVHRGESGPGSDSDDAEPVSDVDAASQRSAPGSQATEEDELATLSQVQREAGAVAKVQENRVWIPDVFVQDLPFFHQPPHDGDTPPATNCPMLMVKHFRMKQQAKLDKERLKAQGRTGRQKSKLGKADIGQRSITEFFAVGKGKGKAVETGPMRSARDAGKDGNESGLDPFSSSDESDGDRRRTRASTPVHLLPSTSGPSQAKASRLHLPARRNIVDSPASQSDGSVIAIDTPSTTQHRRRTRPVVPAPVASSPLAVSAAPAIRQTRKGLMDEPSQVDELCDESIHVTAVTSFKGLRPVHSLASRSSTPSQASASTESYEVEDDSLPDIFSPAFTQAQSQVARGVRSKRAAAATSVMTSVATVTTTTRTTRPASRSPPSSDGDAREGTAPTEQNLNRSPKKSPRKGVEQAYAWSARAGPSGRPGGPGSIDAAGEEDGDPASDGSEGADQDRPLTRPSSPSPLPRRVLPHKQTERSESQDTSASFEIIYERRRVPLRRR